MPHCDSYLFNPSFAHPEWSPGAYYLPGLCSKNADKDGTVVTVARRIPG